MENRSPNAAPALDPSSADRRRWREQAACLAQRVGLLARPAGDGSSDGPGAEMNALLGSCRAARRAVGDFSTQLRRAVDADDDEALLQLQSAVAAASAQVHEARAALDLQRGELAEEEERLSAELASVGRSLEDRAAEGPAESRSSQPSEAATATRRCARSLPAAATTTEADDVIAGLQDEVAQVEAALETLGGASCGWTAEDHAVFLRARTQVCGSGVRGASAAEGGRCEEALLNRAGALLGGYSRAQIGEHASRTAQREALLSRRRALLSTWRQARAERQAAGREVVGEGGGCADIAPPRRRRLSLRPAAARKDAQLLAWREERVRAAMAAEEERRCASERAAAAAVAAAERRRSERVALAAADELCM